MVFSHAPAHQVAHPTVSVTVKPSRLQPMLHTVSRFTQLGHILQLTMAFAREGGSIVGTISGACQGDITGSYTGDSHGKILKGKAMPTCSLGLITKTVRGSFTGKVNSDDTNAQISYNAEINGAPYSGTYLLPLSPQK